MELQHIIGLVTILVTFVLGIISKKNPNINNKIIPIQNLLVGLIVALIEWIITKDFKVAIALSGVFAGGTYDIIHNLQKILKGDD